MKKILIFMYILFSLSSMADTKVLMMIPNDFWWTEYSEPKAEYEKAGFKVILASKTNDKVSPDQRNFSKYSDATLLKADITFDKVNVDDYDAITFVAGNGAWHDFFPNQKVHDILIEAIKKNKVVGLLCASTGLLGLAGNWDGSSTPIAKDKEVVGYFRVESILKELGEVKYVSGGAKDPAVAIDGNLVTGRNPQSSVIFGEAVVKILKMKKVK